MTQRVPLAADRDLHMHTVYCDGDGSPEEMILSAIDKGLKTVGICCHSFTGFDQSYCIKLSDIPRFISELRYLMAKYYDRIHVLCGIEQDYHSEPPSDEFDYVIGSVHYIKAGDEYISVDDGNDILRAAAEKHFGGDIYALIGLYFKTVADVARKTECDIIGHLDLITKFNERDPLFDTHDPRYINAWKNAVDELIPYGVPFEINTGAMSRGYRSQPYPSPEIIEYIEKNGGRLVLSSDAHSKENVAYGFDSVKN